MATAILHLYALALGSNRALSARLTPRRLLVEATARIAQHGRVIAISPTIETPPIGPSRRRYANAALLVQSPLAPPAMLAWLQSIERALGRRRYRRWGARSIDIEELDETSVRAQVTFGDYFLGGNAAAHGGAVSLMFDELLGMSANAGPGGVARTAYLHINYRAITPMNRPLTVTATVYAIEGRKRFVRGELKDGERLCADADGLFLELLPGQQ